MDPAQAELYRKMADVRKQTFVPETGGYLAGYYQDTANQYLQKMQGLQASYDTAKTNLDNLTNLALAAKDRGENTYRYGNDFYRVDRFLNPDGTLKDLNDILRSSQWFSRKQGKMMPGKIGRVIESYQSANADYMTSRDEGARYQQLYAEHMASIEETNKQRHAAFVKQQQETLAGAQLNTYRGATYTEKPK